MTMDSKCNRCDNKPVFYVLLEDDENPYKHHTEQLCEDCQVKAVRSVIEVWTEREWDE